VVLRQSGLSARNPQPPVSLRPERLPLNDPEFPWPRFEAFCRDFIQAQTGVLHCRHYGVAGDAQGGIDLIADMADGTTWAPQCKQKARFSKGDAEKAIAATTYQADAYTVLLSCEATRAVRDVFAARPGWDVWDVRDISAKVRALPLAVAARLVEEHFGSAWREHFLGVRGPSPFVPAVEFFRDLLDPDRLFHHGWDLVGRAETLLALDDFVRAGGARVALLPGRGGSGKSKLLHAFAAGFDERHPDVTLLFLQGGLPVSPESLRFLPTGSSVVVIDDAHQRADLAEVLALLRRQVAPPVRIVLATRPHALERLRSLLAHVGFDATATAQLAPLGQLGRADMKALAAQALGEEYAGWVDRLTAIGGDSPLVTVVGGRLLATKAIPPLLLERDEGFRVAVLDRFRDERIGRVSDLIAPDHCRRLLELVAAVGPVRPGDGRWAATAAAFLGLDTATLAQHLAALAEAGVLLRRGASLRVTPDVVADHLLHRACVDDRGGATGYARWVFDHFAVLAPAQLLANLAELDWRLRAATGAEPDLLDDVWTAIEEEFRGASHRGRGTILDLLKEAAAYQPRRLLALAIYAMRHPAEAPDDSPWAGAFPRTHEDVRQQLPPILRRTAYTIEYLPRCCELLWELGRDDPRGPGQHPDHAMRVLTDLAGYELDKPLPAHWGVARAVEGWLRDYDAHRHAHSPLDVLDALLAREGESSHTEGTTFVIQAFPIDASKTRALREYALGLIMGCAESTDIRLLRRVVASLGRVLNEYHAKFGRAVTDEEHAQWLPERRAVLAHLAALIARPVDPLIQLDIADTLTWHARYDQGEMRLAVWAALAAIPDTFELRLARVLGGYGRLDWLAEEEPPEVGGGMRRLGELARAVAGEVIRRHPDPADGLCLLDGQVAKMQAGGISVAPGALLNALARADPQYAADIADALIADPGSPVAQALDTLLYPIREVDEGRALGLVRRAVATGDPVLCHGVAVAYWRGEWLGRLAPEEEGHIETLLAHPHLAVRREAIRILGPLGQVQLAVAVPLALAVNLDGRGDLADAVCEVFDAHWGIPLDTLTDAQLAALLDTVSTVDSLDHYHTCAALTAACRRAPKAVVRLLIGRLARSDGRDGREGLPRAHNLDLAALAAHDEYADILRDIRDQLLAMQEGHWRAVHDLPDLYQRASANFDATGLAVLREWIEADDPERITGASHLLRSASRTLVFEREDFVVRLLDRADEFGEECGRRVAADLSALAMGGMFSGTPGEPFPEHVAILERSKSVADRLPIGTAAQAFYESLAKDAQSRIAHSEQEGEELFE